MVAPKHVLSAIDHRVGGPSFGLGEFYHGSKCLVAWDNVCLPRDCDGLGVKNLVTQNVCLLLKFAEKALNGHHVPWTTGASRN